MFGSVPLRAVLPDGDIDISMFATAAASGGNDGGAPPAEGAAAAASEQQLLRDSWATQLVRALDREAARGDAPFRIRDVQVIQAEVCAVCSVQCAVCSVQCAVCSVRCAVCSVGGWVGGWV